MAWYGEIKDDLPTCPICGGSGCVGYDKIYHDLICPRCDGEGVV